MSEPTNNLVCRITHEGKEAAITNAPDRNGFSIEIYQAKVYDQQGMLQGIYPTSGYVLSDKTVRVNVMVGINEEAESFDLYRIDLIDRISGVVFAQVFRQDQSIIDAIYGRKKSMLNFYLKLGLIDGQNLNITVSDDNETAIAIQLLDEHKADNNAHSRPDSINENTENTVYNGLHTHQIAVATTAVKGIVKLSTIEESLDKDNDTVAITPACMVAAIEGAIGGIDGVLDASTTQKGVVKLANDAEAVNADNEIVAMTPKQVNAVLQAALSNLMPDGLLIHQGIYNIAFNQLNQPQPQTFVVKSGCNKMLIRMSGRHVRNANNGETSQGVVKRLLMQYKLNTRDRQSVDDSYRTVQDVSKSMGTTSDGWDEFFHHEAEVNRAFQAGDVIQIYAETYTRLVIQLIK